MSSVKQDVVNLFSKTYDDIIAVREPTFLEWEVLIGERTFRCYVHDNVAFV
jgi:hypothetical protein